jgi:transcriptional regulator with XRE-family HTH domain
MNQAYIRQANYWHRGSTLGMGRPNPVICGRKFCARCGRWRHVVDFRPRRDAKTGLTSYCDTCLRVVGRETRAARTLEQRERNREYQRIWGEGKRRRVGIRRREEVLAKRPLRTERILLPIEPLVALLAPYRDDGELTTLARRAGVGERSLGRLLSGESMRVRIDLADKLAVALGVPSALIWRDW